MKVKKKKSEVLISSDPLNLLKKSDLQALKRKAAKTPRKRIRICTHRAESDKFHEMFIVTARGSYVRPHLHMDRTESLHVIEGKADAIFFNNQGKVVQVVRLGNYQSGRVMYYRLARKQFHMLIVRSPFLIFHEATTGPFNRSKTKMAPWAPEDYDKTGIQKFMSNVEKQIRS